MSAESDFAVAVGSSIDFADPLQAAKQFRQRWFGSHSNGHALFFLFTKNLTVTNVQFTELLNLLRLHTYDRKRDKRAKALYFVTSDEFDKLFIEIAEPFAGEQNIGDIIAKLYSELFARTVIVDAYHGSCNVFTPPTLITNLAGIAGEAAYLHSCGYSVFVRNMVKAEPTLLREKLTEHLSRVKPQDGKRLRFLIYAEEDFTARDREDAKLLRDGLDDAKIHVEKAWFRTNRLVDVLNDLKKQMDDRLVFGGGKDSLADMEVHQGEKNIDATRTLWLIQDRSVGDATGRPGDDRYYICYDQLFRSRNAIHIFDENKPGWQDHTTMPPSLAGALINIVRQPGKRKQPWSLADPFLGTGTSLLEALRFQDTCFAGSDNDEVSELLVEDNLEFFRATKKQLNEIYRRFVDAKKELEDAKRGKDDALEKTAVFAIASKLFNTRSLASQAREPAKTILRPKRVPADLHDRLLAYVAVRTSKRYSARFARAKTVSNADWFTAFQQELEELASQISALKKLKKLKPIDATLKKALAEHYKHVGKPPAGVVLLHDSYSVGCMPREHDEPSAAAQRERYTLRVGKRDGDARKLPEDSFDLIIGDPPYGFNTSENAHELATLYREFAKKALQALHDGGHLVLCLPERSHSGRYSPAFTHRDLVVQQLLLTAGEVEKQLVFPHDRVRGADQLYRGDYYWESQRALRRSILHIQARQASEPMPKPAPR